MSKPQTKMLPDAYDVIAPDGSQVRILCGVAGGSMAHFQLAPGQVSRAVRHRTVEEIWYVLSGEGEMWRGGEDVTALRPGLCLTIPVGHGFQFRALGAVALAVVAVTMPPWPGDDEAEPVVGRWAPG